VLTNLTGMKIKINHQESEFADGLSLGEILSLHFPAAQKGTAVAVNGQVVSRQQHAAHMVQPGDNILIIKATQGG
jgi:sulfur carrier protein